jgi:hypothetical protein
MLLLQIVLAAIAGLASACVMTLMEYPFWRQLAMEGVVEWQVNGVMMSKLNKKRTKPNLCWTIASHLSHGVIAGVAFQLFLNIFSSLIPAVRVSLVLDGFLYGVVLWALFLVLPKSMYESAGSIEITNRGLLLGLLSDSIYGLFLGLFLLVL